jgi:hypothetical protein
MKVVMHSKRNIAMPHKLIGHTLLLALLLLPVAAQAMDYESKCEELYIERNRIYKERGYCFKTPRAISTFGNAGCQYDEINQVPLSANERRLIGRYTQEERAYRCPK